MLKHEETVPYIEYKSVAVLLNSLLSGHCVEDAIGLLDNFGAVCSVIIAILTFYKRSLGKRIVRLRHGFSMTLSWKWWSAISPDLPPHSASACSS